MSTNLKPFIHRPLARIGNSNRFIALLWILVFGLTFLAEHDNYETRLKSQIRATLNSVQLTREYQGLVLDTAGTGTLLLNVLKNLGDFRVVRLDVLQNTPQGQSFRIDIEHPNPLIMWLGFKVKLTEGKWNFDGMFLLGKNLIFISLIKSGLLAFLVSLLVSWIAFRSKEQEKTLNAEAKAILVTQIAHDIRSPLAALKVVSQKKTDLSSDDQMLMEVATQRIHDIAENLLQMSRVPVDDGDREQTEKSLNTIQEINHKIELLKREKTLEYLNSDTVEIELKLDSSINQAKIQGETESLIRILSNLINNSIEASPLTERRITVSTLIQPDTTQWSVVVEDFGSGIPDHLISKLGTHGLTYGKKQGNGIGLSHAIQQVKKWHGTFEVESRKNPTRIRISLPYSFDDSTQ